MRRLEVREAIARRLSREVKKKVGDAL